MDLQIINWFLALPAWDQVVMAIVALIATLSIVGLIVSGFIGVIIWGTMIIGVVVSFISAAISSLFHRK